MTFEIDFTGPDEIRAALEIERHHRDGLVQQLVNQVDQSSDDPVAAALAASVKASTIRERKMRRLLVRVVSG